MDSTSDSSGRAPGFLASFRTLGDSLLGSLQEEKFRLIQTFIWICAAVFTAMMAIVFASLTLVYLFWESARLAVLSGLAIFYAGAVVAIIVGLRRFIARQPSPFAATLQEIGEDRACIREEN